MNCKSVQNVLSAYLDRELGGDEMLAVRAHLHDCAACQTEVDELRTLKRFLSESPAPEPPSDLAERLSAAIRAQNPVETPKQRRATLRATVFTFAGVAACSMFLTFTTLNGVRPAAAKSSAPGVATNSVHDAAFDVQRDQVYAVGLDATGGVPVISSAPASAPGDRR